MPFVFWSKGDLISLAPGLPGKGKVEIKMEKHKENYPNSQDGFEHAFEDFLAELTGGHCVSQTKSALRAAFIAGWLAAGGIKPRKNVYGSAQMPGEA